MWQFRAKPWKASVPRAARSMCRFTGGNRRAWHNETDSAWISSDAPTHRRRRSPGACRSGSRVAAVPGQRRHRHSSQSPDSRRRRTWRHGYLKAAHRSRPAASGCRRWISRRQRALQHLLVELLWRSALVTAVAQRFARMAAWRRFTDRVNARLDTGGVGADARSTRCRPKSATSGSTSPLRSSASRRRAWWCRRALKAISPLLLERVRGRPRRWR